MTTPIRGCTGKFEFATFARAQRAARTLRRRDEAAHVAPYHCQHCNRYHIGEDDTGGRLRKGRPRVVRGSQAVTRAQLRALIAAALDEQTEQPQGEDRDPPLHL